MKIASKASGWIALAVLLVTTPAAAIAYDAQNAHRVDGKHAVGAGATKAARAGKLVATNSKGFLPNNIIKQAPNSAKLGGKPKGFFATANHTHQGLPYADVLVVAQSGGDFTTVQGALDSFIGDYDNPVLILVAPGEYEGHVTMERGVDLQGAGRNMTTLRVTAAGAPEVIQAAESSTVSDLSILNSRPDTANVGVAVTHDLGTSMFNNVLVKAETQGGPSAIGFELSGSNTRTIVRNAFVEGRVGADGQALGFRLASGAQLELFDAEVEANGFGNGSIRGINNLGGLATIDDSSVASVGPPTNTGGTVGVATGSASSGAQTTIRDSRIRSGGTDGADRVLLVNGSGSHIEVVGSILRNPSGEAVLQSSPVTSGPFIAISYSKLDGGDNQFNVPSPLLISCLFSYDETFVELSSSCT